MWTYDSFSTGSLSTKGNNCFTNLTKYKLNNYALVINLKAAVQRSREDKMLSQRLSYKKWPRNTMQSVSLLVNFLILFLQPKHQ